MVVKITVAGNKLEFNHKRNATVDRKNLVPIQSSKFEQFMTMYLHCFNSFKQYVNLQVLIHQHYHSRHPTPLSFQTFHVFLWVEGVFTHCIFS